jgi:hypothetical protein
VSTAHLPPADRFAFWHDLVARESARARISSAHRADFAASARVVDLGVVKLGAWSYPSLELDRTASMIGSTDPELYQLALRLYGHGAMTQRRREGVLHPRGFAFVDTTRPHASTHRPDRPGGGPLRTVTALVPHAALPVPATRVTDLLMADIPADEGMGLLLAGFLRQVVDHPEQYGADPQPASGAVPAGPGRPPVERPAGGGHRPSLGLPRSRALHAGVPRRVRRLPRRAPRAPATSGLSGRPGSTGPVAHAGGEETVPGPSPPCG